MEADLVLHATKQTGVEFDTADEVLDLAADIYELYCLKLIAEEIDACGIPRFRPTGTPP
jgi:hypothetical protein